MLRRTVTDVKRTLSCSLNLSPHIFSVSSHVLALHYSWHLIKSSVFFVCVLNLCLMGSMCRANVPGDERSDRRERGGGFPQVCPHHPQQDRLGYAFHSAHVCLFLPPRSPWVSKALFLHQVLMFNVCVSQVSWTQRGWAQVFSTETLP